MCVPDQLSYFFSHRVGITKPLSWGKPLKQFYSYGYNKPYHVIIYVTPATPHTVAKSSDHSWRNDRSSDLTLSRKSINCFTTYNNMIRLFVRASSHPVVSIMWKCPIAMDGCQKWVIQTFQHMNNLHNPLPDMVECKKSTTQIICVWADLNVAS